MTFTCDQALALVASALGFARDREHGVSVAVVDIAGFLVAFGRDGGARPYTADVALGKAYSVIFMDRPSADLRELAGSRPEFFAAISQLGRHALIPSPGGIALPGGAIGVSGATPPEVDVEIAMAAIDRVGLDH